MVHLHSDTRRILLIDQNPFKQNLRATILRNYEVEVHTAASAFDAESLWTANTYDLILLAAIEHPAETIAATIRRVLPRQRIALLVGPPTYLREVDGIPRPRARVVPMSPNETGDAAIRPQWQAMVQRVISGVAS